jgi:drug/metabolite transporter (DMT)-like permease
MKQNVFSTDTFLFVAYAVVCVSGLLLLKTAIPAAQQVWARGNLWSIAALQLGLGVVLYGTSFLLWLVIISRHELSVVYPAALGLTLAFSTLGATVLLGEEISALRLLGIVLIFAGVVCLAQN